MKRERREKGGRGRSKARRTRSKGMGIYGEKREV